MTRLLLSWYFHHQWQGCYFHWLFQHQWHGYYLLLSLYFFTINGTVVIFMIYFTTKSKVVTFIIFFTPILNLSSQVKSLTKETATLETQLTEAQNELAQVVRMMMKMKMMLILISITRPYNTKKLSKLLWRAKLVQEQKPHKFQYLMKRDRESCWIAPVRQSINFSHRNKSLFFFFNYQPWYHDLLYDITYPALLIQP